jgi:hypothetical protein
MYRQVVFQHGGKGGIGLPLCRLLLATLYQGIDPSEHEFARLSKSNIGRAESL